MNNELTTTQDERLLAALSHISVLLPLWGLILSGMVWATQREKSAYVRQQGAQAVGWQVAEILLLLVGFGCYLFSFVFVFLGIMASTGGGDPEPPLLVFAPFLILFLILGLFAVFMLTGLYGAIRSLQGREFAYPVVGRRVRNYLEG